MRDILEDAVSARVDFIADWVTEAELAQGGFELPERSAPRAFDLS